MFCQIFHQHQRTKHQEYGPPRNKIEALEYLHYTFNYGPIISHNGQVRYSCLVYTRVGTPVNVYILMYQFRYAVCLLISIPM